MDKNLSVIMTDAASEVKLPAINVRNIGSQSAVQLIERCFDIEPRVAIDSDVFENNEIVFNIRATGVSSDVVVLNIKHVVMASTEEATKKRYEEFLMAVETGLQLLGEGPGSLKIHQETKLLFFRGTKRQIETVQQIVQQIGFQAGPRMGPGSGGSFSGSGLGGSAGGGAGPGGSGSSSGGGRQPRKSRAGGADEGGVSGGGSRGGGDRR